MYLIQSTKSDEISRVPPFEGRSVEFVTCGAQGVNPKRLSTVLIHGATTGH
ncbi:hypothetical protein SAMN06264365_11780 [Actinoplanes regularis]|uniref:Uncharacterized protein n=1 Tax=Actinoplanes regularis TaxID=52697 RepID=A0A239F6H4_9ACTN|nr:hypothetical protein SAMN06264365_11780 [Actinoplanes regularis]